VRDHVPVLEGFIDRLRGALRRDPRVVDDGEFTADAGIDAPVVDVGDLTAQIVAETGIDAETVARVLDLEAELQEGVGLASPPRGTFLYYDTADFARLGPDDGGDTGRIADDAERLLKIPRMVALEVLDAETRQLQQLGIARAD
jgi:hypothetical protein